MVCCVAAVEGEIDGSNAADLRLALSERLPSTASALVLDLSQVRYLDSSGIHLLFDLGRRLAARRQAIRLVVPDGRADETRARALRDGDGRADGPRPRGILQGAGGVRNLTSYRPARRA